MKLSVLALTILTLPFCLSAKELDLNLLREGDILFQETSSRQAKALKLATHSRYTHVGILFRKGASYEVLEAVQPVRFTSLNHFVKRGVNNHLVVKRLKKDQRLLNPETIARMRQYGSKFLGRDYDLYFEWTDDRFYCTELVWKIYKQVPGVEIGPLKKLKDFDLNHPYVKNLMKKRYGSHIPYEERVISVSDMFNSSELRLVWQQN